jgi:hypothetical protein
MSPTGGAAEARVHSHLRHPAAAPAIDWVLGVDAAAQPKDIGLCLLCRSNASTERSLPTWRVQPLGAINSVSRSDRRQPGWLAMGQAIGQFFAEHPHGAVAIDWPLTLPASWAWRSPTSIVERPSDGWPYPGPLFRADFVERNLDRCARGLLTTLQRSTPRDSVNAVVFSPFGSLWTGAVAQWMECYWRLRPDLHYLPQAPPAPMAAAPGRVHEAFPKLSLALWGVKNFGYKKNANPETLRAKAAEAAGQLQRLRKVTIDPHFAPEGRATHHDFDAWVAAAALAACVEGHGWVLAADDGAIFVG